MNYTSEQIINGLLNYADTEVMTKLPTSGKWVMGTAIMLASNKIPIIVDNLKESPVVKMLGIVDEEDNIDADALINAMRSASEKYGSMTLDVPLVGRLTFNSNDIERLKTYLV